MNNSSLLDSARYSITVLKAVALTLQKLHWLPAAKQLVLKDAIMTYKCMNSLVSSYLSSTFTERSSFHKHKTRNSHKLQITLYRTSLAQLFFVLNTVQYLFGTLCLNMLYKRNPFKTFKSSLRKYLIEN